MVSTAEESPNRAHGFAADKVYQFNDVDSVNLFNGGLIIPIPLGQTYKVSEGLSYRLTVVYNGNVWDYGQRCYFQQASDGGTDTICKNGAFLSRTANAGLGFLVTLGELVPPSSEQNQTEDWIYVSPDGARHVIVASFFRMREISPTVREVDFPDGTTQRFEPAGPIWHLTEIRDRYSVIGPDGAATTNFVHVRYTTWSEEGESGNEAVVEDSAGRVQRIKFIPGSVDTNLPPSLPFSSFFSSDGATGNNFGYPPSVRDSVRSVEVTGRDGTPEKYTFEYESAELLRGAGHTDAALPSYAKARMLRSLTLPDGSSYAFTTNAGELGYAQQGELLTFRLPTGGRINYTYKNRTFPIFPPQFRVGKAPYEIPPDVSITIKTRELQDSVPGALPALWTYSDSYEGDYGCAVDESFTVCPALELKVTVTDPLGNLTENFFSIAQSSRYMRTEAPGVGNSPYQSGWRDGEYGLPFTHLHPTADGKRFLSTRVYDDAGTLLRSTYIKYDGDDPNFDNARKDVERNHPRLLATRTIYEDDTSCGGEPCYVDVENDSASYDGFGHYRRQVTTSNFGPTRETFTGYNNSPTPTDRLGKRNGVYAIAPDQPWIIDQYDEQRVTEAGVTAYKKFCFDPLKGRLLRLRTMLAATAGEEDLVTALEYDAYGNLQKESFYGGDGSVSAPEELCDFIPANVTPQYAIHHESSNGVLTNSDYVDPESPETKVLSTYDVDLDASIGMPKLSRDAAGLETDFKYDVMGRIKEVHPPGAAWTEYIYKKAGDEGYPDAAVIVRQHPFDDDTAILSESQIDYDGFGRIYKETTVMPGGTKSVRRTTYNKNGWKETVSERGATPSTHVTTFSAYDPFGRAHTTTAPDGSSTTVDYVGAKTVTRKVGVAMVADADDTEVTTTEKYDAYGRLVSVTEPSGTFSDPAHPEAANVTTTYAYDVANHLTSADTTDLTATGHPHQPRTFTYDLRGFLKEESHPEKGTTHYLGYDARGHLLHKKDGTSTKYDLTYTYDDAERLTEIASAGNPIKEFFFDKITDGGHDITGPGRLLRAIRHNRSATLGDIQVADYFAYDDAGRVKTRETRLSTGPVFSQSFTYTDAGQPKALHYPTCTNCGSASQADRNIELGYSYGLLTGVAGFTSSLTNGITYWPNGMLHKVVHAGNGSTHNTTDTQGLDPHDMVRPASIEFTGYCVGPALVAPSPASRTVLSGDPVEFSIAAPGGVASPRYQWYRGARGVTANPVAGATSATLHIDALTQSATYWVRVTGDSGCSSDSTTVSANLLVCNASALSIMTEPHSTSTVSGGTVTLTVVASASATSYQWYEGVSGSTVKPLPGQTQSTLTVHPTVATAYWVRVKAASGCSVDSMTAVVGICVRPTVMTQPRSMTGPPPTALHPTTLTTSVDALGENLSYTWHQVENPDFVSYGRILSKTYEIGAALNTPETFYCSVSSASSSPDCSGHEDSDPVTFTLTECIKLISSPGDHVVYPGGNIIPLSVRVEGPGPFHYAWYHGTNGQSFPLNVADAPDINVSVFGEYDAFWCEVTSDSCPDNVKVVTPKSYARHWNACPLPPVNVSPLRATLGAPATFTATVDWPGVTYQWYRGQKGDTRTPLDGETHATLTVTPAVATTYWLRVTDECGEHYEDANIVSVMPANCDPIVINAQPQSVDTVSGAATLRTDASSARPLTYTWFRQVPAEPSRNPPDPVQMEGTGASLVVHPTETTTYYAVVSNGCFAVETLPAMVHVKSCGAISITAQPMSTFIRADAPTAKDLFVTATAIGGSLTYQWYEGESGDTSHKIDGATSYLYHASPTKTTSYWVRITNETTCAVDSDTAVITWCVPPHFSPAMMDVSIRQGTAWLLHSTAQGTNLTYKWHLGSADGAVVSTDADFWVAPGNTTSYVLEAISGCDPSASIFSNPVVVSVCTTPVITEQPKNTHVFPGKTATLTIAAAEGNDVPLTYHWFDENGAAVGTSSPTFTTPPITAEKKYSVHLQAGLCEIDSQQAMVSLCSLPEIFNPGETFNVALGETVVMRSGSGPLSGYAFAWYRGPVHDTANPVCQNGHECAVFATASATYWATVTHPDGCVSHTGAYVVNVCVPTITQQPASVMRMPNQASVPLSVAAGLATAYQWYVGEKGEITTPVPGGTTATINVSPTVPTRYWVRVTGSCGVDQRGAPIGAVDSESALVTVCNPPAIVQTTPGPWIARGSSFTLGVVATGTGLTYQWYTGATGVTSAPIAGATSENLTVSPQNTTSYWVRVSGTCDTKDSVTMTVSVCATPVITAQPQNVTIFSGSTTTLSVTATEATTSPVGYQWYRGNPGDTSTPVGTSAATYTTPALTSDTSYWVRVSCGTCTPADSQKATVSMCPGPQTLSAPPDQQTTLGQSVRLTGVATTGGNIYMWFRGASGNTSTPLTEWQPTNYLDVAPTVTTQYWYRVQNGTCLSNSGTVTVNVCVPTITTQPLSQMINPGASATLSVVANTPGLTYQWYIGASGTTTSPISGATGASLTVTPPAATNYWVRVTGSCGRTTDSTTAAITICQPPSITQTTPGPWIVRGSSFTLGVVTAGTSPTYQWYVGASGNTAAPISGATGSNYTAAPQNTTSYWVRVSGACGFVNSITMTISVCMPPAITAQPQSVSIFSGATATLSVTASQSTTSPVNYQWYRGAAGDASVPVGTNSATFTTPALTSQTSYWVRVSCGTCTPADSQTATVSICPYAPIVGSSGDVQTTVGQQVRLSTTPSGGGNTYSWYSGAAGDTTHPLTAGTTINFIDIGPTVTSQYWAQVVTGSCVSRTDTVTVNVCVPQITQQPQSITIAPGASTTLTAAANTAGVAYQWYTGTSGITTSPISGATSSSRTVTPGATTSYWVRATSTCGRTVDSATATVTICSAPVITRQPNDAPPTQSGYAANVDVLATGTGLTYQWYQGETGDTHAPVDPRYSTGGTTSALSYTLSATTRVWVRITGQCGSVDSRAVWLSVAPIIAQHPYSQAVSSGSSASVSVLANGAYLTYQWMNAYTGAAVPGASQSATLVVPSVTSPMILYCRVTSGTATVYSSSADITLCNGPTVTTSWGYSGSCRWIVAQIYGEYSEVEWYRGQPGDTSNLYATGISIGYCPTAPTTFWCRVYAIDPNSGTACNADSGAVTVSP